MCSKKFICNERNYDKKTTITNADKVVSFKNKDIIILNSTIDDDIFDSIAVSTVSVKLFKKSYCIPVFV